MTRDVRALDRSVRPFIVAPVALVVIGAGLLVARALAPKLHARLVAGCERMFEQMPDSFPPKRMMRGIEEIRATSARTLALLEAHEQTREAETRRAASTGQRAARLGRSKKGERAAVGASAPGIGDVGRRDHERRTDHSAG
jgi:hypothetical protein